MPQFVGPPDPFGMADYEFPDGSIGKVPTDHPLFAGAPTVQAPADPLLSANADAVDRAVDSADSFIPSVASPVPDEVMQEVAPEEPLPPPESKALPPSNVMRGVPGLPQEATPQPQAQLTRPAPSRQSGFTPPTVEDHAAMVAPGLARQEEAMTREAAAQGEIDRLGGEQARREMAVQEASQAQRAKIQKQREDAWNASTARVQAAEQAIKEIDPNRLWTSADSLGKARMTAGAFLSGLLAPYNGGKNAFIETMMQQIDNDIRAQQSNQQVAMQKLGMARDDRGLERQRYGDLLADEDVKRAGMLFGVASGIKAESAKYQSDITKAKFDRQAGELFTKAGEFLSNARNKFFEQSMSLQAQQEQIAARKAQIGLGYANLNENKRQFDKTHDLNALKAMAEASKIPGTANLKNTFQGSAYGVKFTKDGKETAVIDVGDETAAKEMNDAARKGTLVVNAIDRVRQIYKPGRKVIGNKDRELVQQAINQVYATYVTEGGRSMGDKDLDIVMSGAIEGDPNAIRRIIGDSTIKDKITNFRAKVVQDTETYLNRYQDTFGKATFNPEPPKMYKRPTEGLDWAQTQTALKKELAKATKADPATINGLIESYGDLASESTLSPSRLDFDGANSLIVDAYNAALQLPQYQSDPVMQEYLKDATAGTLGKIAADKAYGTVKQPGSSETVIKSRRP